MKNEVLLAIANANDEDSMLYVRAAIQRREVLLGGGHVLYRELTKEEVMHLEEQGRRVRDIREQENWN